MKQLRIAIVFLLSTTACLASESTDDSQHNRIPIPEIIFTPLPTETPVLPAPSPTQVSIKDKYNLPEWLLDPEASIFMHVTDINDGAKAFDLTFRNADSDEYFSITLPLNEITAYFWLPDGKGFGFSGKSFPLYYIDSMSGKVETIYEADKKIHMIHNVNHIFPAIFLKNESTYTLVRKSGAYTISANQSFIARLEIDLNEIGTGYSEGIVFIKNIENGEEIPITNSNDGLHDLMFQWHPIESLIAVIQGPIPPFPEIGNQVTFYNVQGDVVKTFYFDTYITNFDLSPNGEFLLYSKVQVSSDGYDYKNYPCIRNYFTKEETCFFEIEVEHQITRQFRWASDNNSIWYIGYENEIPLICFYDLSTIEISCPVNDSLISIIKQKEKELSPNFPAGFGNFNKSIDGRYVVISLPTIGHFFPYPIETLVININTQSYLSLGFNEWDSDNDLYIRWPEHSIIWRPTVVED